METELPINIADCLAQAPILSGCNRQELARLATRVEVRQIGAGDKLFEANEPAATAYLLCSGTARLMLDGREVTQVSTGFLGEEAAINARAYLADAVAIHPLLVIAIPRESLHHLLRYTPTAVSGFYDSLINHYTDSQPPQLEKLEKKDDKQISSLQPVGWVATMAIPTMVYWYCSAKGMDSRAVNYLAVFSATTLMWIFRLLPEFIPAIFLVLASIILGVVPTKVVLSGFSSGSFFMAMSVFGIGAVLVRSGLTYRIVLWLLRRSPQSQLGYQFSMLVLGLLLTPVLPSANGRVALILPLLKDMKHSLRYKRGGVAATGLAAAAFTGVGLFSPVFLTSKSINFVVYALFPGQVQYQFSWGYWAMAAAVAGLVMLLGHLIFSWLFFRNDEEPKLDRERVLAQLAIIGPVSRDEWIALGAIALFFLGVLTASLHKIHPPWIGLAVFYLLLALGVFSKSNVRRDINWPFLLMLAGMISIVQTMSHLGLDAEIKQQLEWLGVYMHDNLYLFLLLLSLAIFLVRFVVPNNATIILTCSLFLPIAEAQGINAWLIAFIVLLISDGWFMGYQCTYYVAFREGAEEDGVKLYEDRKMLLYNLCMNFVRVVAIFASLPYWRELGLL
ncbi:MAG: anion permease [Deltaproteobacteria bacterium]|nr:MAG: anion permease [Deltaproteobacteria bacterium]